MAAATPGRQASGPHQLYSFHARTSEGDFVARTRPLGIRVQCQVPDQPHDADSAADGIDATLPSRQALGNVS